MSSTFGVDARDIRSSISYNATTGRLYFTSKGGYCFAIKFNTGTGRFIIGGGNSWCSNIGYSTSTPAVYDGKVFVGLGGMYGGSGFRVLYETNGTIKTSIATNGPVQASPVISVNAGTGAYHVYFTTNAAAGRIYCVNGSSETIAWDHAPTGATYTLQGVAISDGYLYFGNDYGYMYGYH